MGAIDINGLRMSWAYRYFAAWGEACDECRYRMFDSTTGHHKCLVLEGWDNKTPDDCPEFQRMKNAPE